MNPTVRAYLICGGILALWLLIYYVAPKIMRWRASR